MRTPLLFLVLAGCGQSLTIAMVQQNNSGQDGFAVLTEAGELVEIEVKIKRSNVDGNQTSHVHEGRCDNVGKIAAGIRMANPLEISNKANTAELDGELLVFKTQLQTPLSALRDGKHVINVHDARDSSLYTSCGEID